MELTLHYYWVYKAVFLLSILFTIYKVYKSEFTSKSWGVTLIVLTILANISPVKLKPITDSVNTLQNISIENSKKLPEFKQDNRFKSATHIEGIKPSDLQ